MPRTRASVVYWYWRDPRDGKEKPLKCPNDRETAIRRARELNALVARDMADRIVTQIIQPSSARPAIQGMPFNAWGIHYLRRIEKRQLAANTMRSRKSLINAAAAHFGTRPLHELAEDIAACTHYLESIEAQGKNRTALAMRSVLIDVFAEAQASGALAASLPNPFGLTIPPKAHVKRARLTLDDWHTIEPHLIDLGTRIGQWVHNASRLALVTGQRREDLAIMQFKRGKDWQAAWIAHQRGEAHPIVPYPFVEDGLLWVVQQKTGNLVRIPLELRLDALNLSLGEVIDQCRTRVISRYVLHHTRPFLNAPAGSPIHRDTITRQFAAARNAAGLTNEGRTPPTFHELRSLSERLYRDQGINTQALLGHRHARMTEVYHDPRGAEWSTVKMA